ncbi:hypothetical protein NQZ68_010509 [Dissostichus eleginoides]|nr:hypothetical protein NQZ68_010509 [Dissostichus eleginoides]
MASAGLQIFAIFLASIGFLWDIVICALPMWKMNCVMQRNTGQMQCKVYDSMLALSLDLPAARALVVISILVALMGIMLAVAGGQCTNCIEDEEAKSKVAIAAGVFFIVSSILCMIPVSWSANTCHQKLLQSHYERRSEEGAGSRAVHWLGSIRTYADWTCTSLLSVSEE